jgi:hypothetical protein
MPTHLQEAAPLLRHTDAAGDEIPRSCCAETPLPSRTDAAKMVMPWRRRPRYDDSG